MDIKELFANEAASTAITSFVKANGLKADFYGTLTKHFEEILPVIKKDAELKLKDSKDSLERWLKQHAFDNYEFRYGKKFKAAAIFIPSGEIKIGPRDTITFKGRKADKPQTLVFEVEPEVAEGADQPSPYTVEIDEPLVLDWLKYGMVH